MNKNFTPLTSKNCSTCGDKISCDSCVNRIILTAIDQAETTVLITDTEGIIVYANPKFYTVTQYTPEDITGKTPRILSSHQTSKQTYEELWTTLKSGIVWRGEFLNKTKNDTLFWEIATITPLRNEDGEVTHFMKIAEVMDELKHTVLNLWSIVSLTAHYILILGPDMTIKFANDQLASDLGYRNETEIVGKNWMDHIPQYFKDVIPYVHDRLMQADTRYREFTNDISTLSGEFINVKWFNSFINGQHNWTLCIGIPLVVPVVEQSIKAVRKYWKEAIRQDRMLIDSIKSVAALRQKEDLK
jgi:PAS domain S-box-containing protein